MEYNELLILAEKYYKDALDELWDSINERSYEDIKTDFDRDRLFDLIWEMLEKNSSDINN